MKAPPFSLRILSYNIHKGFSTSNRDFVLNNIRDAIRLVHADIVFLQEVLGEHSEHSKKIESWPSSSQFEFLADSVWSHYAYGKNAIYQRGHHGNAILSKFPILSWEHENISTNALEQRGLLHAIIDVPELKKPLDCICVHLDLLQRGRNIQIQKIVERIGREVEPDHPLLIAGDFNDWRRMSTDVLMRQIQCDELFFALRGSHARTYPSFFPILQLDRIYFRGFKPKDAQVLTGEPWRRLSDHGAIFGELFCY